MATVITNLLSAIPFIGKDIVPLITCITLYYMYYISVKSSNEEMLINNISEVISNINGVQDIKKDKHNEEFSALLSWIVGFIDGDGYIRVTKKEKKVLGKLIKNYIVINLVLNLHKNDYNLLCEIRDILGIGKVYYITTNSKKVARYEINKRDLINIFFPLLKKYNISFITKIRQEQYLKALYIINNNIKYYNEINNNDLLNFIKKGIILDNFNSLWYFNNWIVGFTIAEGSFIKKKNNDLCFKLKQKYNLILFSNILAYFGTSQKLNINKKIYVEYSLSSKKDVQKIVNFFSYNDFINHPNIDKYPTVNFRGLKLESYNKWLIHIKESNRYKNIILP